MGEEFEVAAPHQAKPGTDQPNGPVAKVVCLPGDAGRHTALPEQPFGNRAIRLAGEVCIKCAEDEHQSLAPRRSKCIRRGDVSLGQSLPEAMRSVSAGGETRIEGDDRCNRRRRCSTADEYDGSAVVRTADDFVFPIACRMQKYLPQRIDAAHFAKPRGRGREKNDRRSKMRQPNWQSSVRAFVRVEKETAVPSG